MFKLHEKQPRRLFYAAIMPAAIAVFLLNGCATSVKRDKPEKGLEASENIAVTGQGGETPAAHTENREDAQTRENDPMEGFNRAMFGFNEKVDTYIAEPIANAYKWITPKFVQTGISNFYANTKTVNVVLNDVLQGKLKQSAQDTGRFLVNSTIGVAGLFDVASRVGLDQHDEDFDQTLAVWGVPTGAYLVLPILGPSTARGIPGSVVDTAANPVTYVGFPVQALGMLNARANAEGALKFIDEAALDPYVFTRESFLQWRDYLSSDGKAKAAAVTDEFEDELEENVAEEPGEEKSTAAVKVTPSLTPSTVETGSTSAGAAQGGGAAEIQSPAAVQTDKNLSTPKLTNSAALKKADGQGAAVLSNSASKPTESSLSAPW
jgi:phospholipid-binding lipoprotein MlaA